MEVIDLPLQEDGGEEREVMGREGGGGLKFFLFSFVQVSFVFSSFPPSSTPPSRGEGKPHYDHDYRAP